MRQAWCVAPNPTRGQSSSGHLLSGMKGTTVPFWVQGKALPSLNSVASGKRRRGGGDYRIRTDDPLLAKQMLYQLS